MSCGGCGCCTKCGCQATCTCNRNIWSLESPDDYSNAAGTNLLTGGDGQQSGSQGSFQSYDAVENGGRSINCGWHAPGCGA